MADRHAVVLGGSMTGLGVARALSNHFEHVTVVERDKLSESTSSESRKGVPQGNHGHALLAAGYRILDAYFPTMMQELVAAGATPGDLTGDYLFYQFGNYKLRTDLGTRGVIMTRPLLESLVRKHVRALGNVTVLDNHDVVEPIHAQGRVTGVFVKNRDNDAERRLDASLVVDVTGRGSQAPKWLKSWGYPDVEETQVKVDVGYATAQFAREPGELHGTAGILGTGTPPASKRGGACFAVENQRWVVTLGGWLRDYPPTDLTGFREFARTLPFPEIYDLVKDREPVGEIYQYRFPSNRRRHYDKLARYPQGFLVLGDAVVSFNPLYGQGMTVGLSEAKALDELLARGEGDLWKRFYHRLNDLVLAPWTIACGEDLRFPEVEGPRPPGSALINKYMERVHRASAKDAIVYGRFISVINLLEPPEALLSPAIAWRVLVGGVGPKHPSHTVKQ